MKKLSLSILALLLAATTFAAPPGWVEGVASKDVSAAVAADPSALHRGGALIVDHATLQTQLLPWSDGDSITLDFVLPGEPFDCGETPVGWECAVSGSTWRAGVADLDGVKGIGKLATALDDFTAPGAQSYVRIPIAEVPSTGEWTIDKQLGGDWGDFNFVLQPELTAQEITDGAYRPPWAVNSIAVYHKTKQNDRTGGFKYMTGKAAHLPAPVAVGFRSNQTTITGWTYGAWEIDTDTGLLTKVFDAAVIQGWNNTASVVVDATLGYTTGGGTSQSLNVNNLIFFYNPDTAGNAGYIAPEDGDIDSVSFLTQVTYDGSTNRWHHQAAYINTGAINAGNLNIIAASELPLNSAADGWTGTGPYWNTTATSGSFSEGDEIVHAVDRAGLFYYDSATGTHGGTFKANTINTAMPSTVTNNTSGASFFNRIHSVYLTYTASGGGGAATPPGKLGLDTSLSL